MLIVSWVVATYLLIGLYMATFGPLGSDIRKQIRASSRPAITLAPGQEEGEQPMLQQLPPAPRWRVVAFATVLVIGAVLGWAIFLPGVLAARRRRKDLRL